MTTWVIAWNTIGEALRKKILVVFLVVALALIVLSVSFSQFSFREELTIIKSLGLGLIAIVGMLISIVLGINLITAEVERKTIYTILSKPVRRYEFLLGKFFGALGTILINLLIMTVVFMSMIAWKNHWHPDWALLKGVLMIFFQLFILSSITLVFSVFATPVLNFFMTAAVYIIGSLSDITQSLAQKPNSNIITKGFYNSVHYLIPQFANYFTQNPLIHPEVQIQGELRYYVFNIAYAIVYVAAVLIIAVIAFERRDM
jgi:ABC-type transport system involved in multi-copper enzyme maturation permease subunit